MAKIQMSIEELLQLLKGEMELPEIKNQLAKALLDVWQRDETKKEIEAKGEELARKKMERIIEGSFSYQKGSWGRGDTISGWAIPVIKDAIQQSTLPMILEAIRPELEKLVSELVQKEFGSIVMNMIKSHAIQESN